MPSQREIRRRIASVRNIKQITRAMQFVAASKLKRAQDATLQSRPYAEKIDEVLADLASVLGGEDHPLLAKREEGPRLLVLLTTDRGLAGSLNTNTIRFVAQQITEDASDLAVVTVGRKGQGAMRRARLPIVASFDGFGDRPSFASVVAIARLLTNDYVGGKYRAIDMIYPRFISTLTQRPIIKTILPVEQPEMEEQRAISNDEYLFEPSPEAVLHRLLPHYVAVDLYRAVLENNASEESARMVAMRSATDNANELIDDLTLVYNKTRQATITREMIEIASGAEALG